MPSELFYLNSLAKATHIFFSKNICELDIILTRTVNILTTNKLVKLTMLEQPGPVCLLEFLLNEMATIIHESFCVKSQREGEKRQKS